MSKACCSLPPVSAEYTPKGTYGKVAGLKSYTVGPEDAKAAVLVVYDVFGYSPQILQGADILASGGYRVVMPDFLQGSYATADMFSGTPEGNAKRDKYFSGFPGVPTSQSDQIGAALAEVKAKYPKVGTVGYCWGWKATTTAKDVNDFTAIATCHPSFIDVEDADKVNVPVCLLPSKDEDKKTVNAVYEKLEQKNPGQNTIKWYDNDVHGWAAARGDLSGNEHTKAYQEAYADLLTFFKAKL
jgi:dienelactone hydrolase